MQEFNYPSAREIVSDFLRRRGESEDVTVDDVLAKHHELENELIKEFSKLHLISSAMGSDSTVRKKKSASEQSTATNTPIVRCPHCGEPTNATLEESIKAVGCKGCGEIFSLVRDLNWPNQIDHFKLIERLGMGSYGAVWKARDERLGRFVALKLPRRSFIDESEATLFLHEAQTAAALSHPNIVKVHEVGTHGGSIYIASELIDGESLALRCKNGIALRQVIKLTETIARALHFAHEKGIIHRDLKPQNVLLDKEGTPYLADFGLASRQSDAHTPTVTMSGEVLGTIGYMCPEQARGDSSQADARSDVYALGAMLYQLLTGNVPFQGDQVAVLRRIQTEDPIHPRKLNHRVSLDLDTVCMKCLEKEPDKRYQTAQEVSAELGRVTRGEPILARPIGIIGETTRWAMRNPVSTAFAVAVLFASLAAIFATNYIWAQNKVSKANRRNSLIFQVRQIRVDRQFGYRDEIEKLIDVNRDLLDDEDTKRILRKEFLLCLGDSTGFSAQELNLEATTAIRRVAVNSTGEKLAIAFKDDEHRWIELRDVNGMEKAPEIPVGEVAKGLSFADYYNGDLLVVDVTGWLTRVSTIDYKIISEKNIRNRIPPHSGEAFGHINHARFTANGDFLLVAWSNSELQLYDLQQESSSLLTAARIPETATLKCLDISTNGDHVVAGYSDSLGIISGVLHWDRTAGRAPPSDKRIPMGTLYGNSIALSHDAKWLVVGGEPTVLLDLKTLEQRSSFFDTEVYALAFCPDTNYLAVNYITGIVEIQNYKTNAYIGKITQSKRGEFAGVTFSQDGRNMFTWSDGGLRIVPLGGHSERELIDVHSRGVPSVKFTPDGSKFVSGSKDGSVRFWDSNSLQALERIEVQGQVQSVAVNKDLFAVAEWRMDPEDNETISIWKTSNTHGPIKRIRHELGTVCGLGISHDEKFLAASGDNGISIWRILMVPNGRYAFEEYWSQLQHEDSEFEGDKFLTFDDKGRVIAHANRWGDDVRLIDLRKEPPVSSRLGGDSKAKDMYSGWHSLAFTLDNQLLLVGPNLGIDMWSTADLSVGGEKMRSTPDNFFADSQISLSKTGLLAGITGGRTISIWDINILEELYTFRAEVSAIYSLAWNPTRDQLVVGRADGGISVWDLTAVRTQLKKVGFE